jgi:hypothetical protein
MKPGYLALMPIAAGLLRHAGLATHNATQAAATRNVPRRAFLPSLIIITPTLWLPSICKARVRATVRKSPGGGGLALPITYELTQAGVAVVLTLQAVGIITSSCGRGSKNYSHKSGGSNDLAHFSFLS